ncbi:HNH endonuclease [Vibrio parahaemolyticus]|uniref:HNH endonuclease n=1 Tax=Vibrio parahaemolyticus TaxID=670 RepID=UPI001FADC3A7|nr:HNH endonuclease [Vibrio parahaemolyticus]
MAKFVNDSDQELDSEFSLETIQNFDGLVIESWGPSPRNPEYAKAFELLLERLKSFQVPSIRVFAVSNRLAKVFPNILDRELLVSGKCIALDTYSAHELRLAIGKQVSMLKESPNTSKGGNRYKRILVYSPLIEKDLWFELATTNSLNDSSVLAHLKPTSDSRIFEQQVDSLELSTFDPPVGNKKPKRKSKQTNHIQRDPLVKAWVLRYVQGVCELCESQASFIKDNGKPYMEVHHVRRLTDGGSDTIYNTVGVCPNCHRALHYSVDRDSLINTLYCNVERLISEYN